MLRILCLFLNFLSLKNIVIIDVYLKSSIFLCLWRAILMCDFIGALSLFLAFSVRSKELGHPKITIAVEIFLLQL